jgi:hypothetical protein
VTVVVVSRVIGTLPVDAVAPVDVVEALAVVRVLLSMSLCYRLHLCCSRNKSSRLPTGASLPPPSGASRLYQGHVQGFHHH